MRTRLSADRLPIPVREFFLPLLITVLFDFGVRAQHGSASGTLAAFKDCLGDESVLLPLGSTANWACISVGERRCGGIACYQPRRLHATSRLIQSSPTSMSAQRHGVSASTASEYPTEQHGR